MHIISYTCVICYLRVLSHQYSLSVFGHSVNKLEDRSCLCDAFLHDSLYCSAHSLLLCSPTPLWNEPRALCQASTLPVSYCLTRVSLLCEKKLVAGEKTPVKTSIAPLSMLPRLWVGEAWMEHCVGPMLVVWQRQCIQVWMCG